MQKAKVRENVKEYALLTLGTVIMTLGIYFFKFPNHFSTGGVSGMAGPFCPFPSPPLRGRRWKTA